MYYFIINCYSSVIMNCYNSVIMNCYCSVVTMLLLCYYKLYYSGYSVCTVGAMTAQEQKSSACLSKKKKCFPPIHTLLVNSNVTPMA